MQYRSMPNSKEKLSVLGYGCMRMPTKAGAASSIDIEKAKQQLLYAIDNGVNYLDTAYPYHRGASESFLGEHILKNGYREKVNIATKLPVFLINKAEKMDEIFSKQLEKLKVDYIDYYLLHALEGSGWDKMKRLGVIEWMDKIRKQGKVRKMGFSFHGTYESFVSIIDEYNWDFVQVQYNILDENLQAGIRGIKYANSKGLGVIVMEPLRGGSLAGKVPKQIKEIYDEEGNGRSPAYWALRWICDRPEVTVVLSGMNDLGHIKENIMTASESLALSMTKEQADMMARVKDGYLKLMTVGCTSCGYCMPCPYGINIPEALKNLNSYHMFGKLSSKFFHITFSGIMTKDGKPHLAASCTRCGACEKKCPQHIEIRKELMQVKKHLEGPFMRAFAFAGRAFLNLKKQNRKAPKND